MCELTENLVLENKKYTAGVVVNFVTLACFLALYFVEVRRENTLINYLEVSANVASDNVSVGKTLELLPKEKQASIHFLDKCYQRGGFFIIFLFVVYKPIVKTRVSQKIIQSFLIRRIFKVVNKVTFC
jgi:hypothetical protein